MTRLATTPAILGILLTGMVAVLVGCSSNPAGLGLQKVDAQAPALDAAAGHGGVGGAGSDAAVGGSGGSGGVAGSGGVTATGGVTQTGGTTGTGGTTRTGGATGTGGPTPTGGTTGDGGATRTGGTTGAGGATVTGGSTRTGGATGSGGTTQTGGATGTGGATRTGGATGNGGSTGGGGSTRIGGAIGNGGSTGAGGTTGAGGSTRTGGTTASGGTTGTGGAGGAGKTCGGNVGTSCAVGEFCDIQAGLCSAAGATGTCAVKPQICGDVYQPVCGCDRTTYANDCARQVAGVSKRSNGACATGDAGATTCGQVTTQADCDSRSDCHSVFVDPGTCGCAVAGCCAHFNICANGGHANCSGPVAFGCTIAPPFCELPYVLSYTANCYEGCVRQSECAGVDAGTPATCPSTPPTNASSCSSPSMTCFYDDCPSTGRTQAICTGGTWSVQTAACGTVSCTGYPYSGGMTCPSGQMCLISVGGALLARCIDNACGQGPVTSQCSYVTSGCSMNATLTTGVTFTCNSCPVGEVCG